MSKLNVKSMKKSTLDHLITFAMVIVAYLIVQILIAAGVLSSLMQGLLVPMCTYSIVAIGLNLCVGYLGELSIGHAGFMCVGAFSSAFATKLLQNVIPNQIILFITVLIIGTAAAAFFGFLIGIPVLRLRGDYLAIVTLAFGEIIKNVINVLYIAKDTDGFHFAISNGNAIKLSDEGEWLINGAKGIAKKVAIFLVISVAHVADQYLVDSTDVLRSMTTLFYLSNEGISIFENIGKIGIPLPGKLNNLLSRFEDIKNQMK